MKKRSINSLPAQEVEPGAWLGESDEQPQGLAEWEAQLAAAAPEETTEGLVRRLRYKTPGLDFTQKACEEVRYNLLRARGEMGAMHQQGVLSDADYWAAREEIDLLWAAVATRVEAVRRVADRAYAVNRQIESAIEGGARSLAEAKASLCPPPDPED